MVLAVVAVTIAMIGPGEFSVDDALGVADDLDGYVGLAISAGGGLAAAALLLARVLPAASRMTRRRGPQPPGAVASAGRRPSVSTMSADVPLGDLIDLGGRRALVTGGGKGIGAAIAERLIEAGATVTIADLDPDAADEAGRIGAEFVACDIADADQLRHAVDVAAGTAGLDVLVNNAGIFPTTGPLTDVTDEFVQRMLDVNVRAQFSATREAAARMPNGGSIVNLASIAALGGGANISAYAASKAAVIALTRAAANRTRTGGDPRQRHRAGCHRHARRAGATGAAPRRGASTSTGGSQPTPSGSAACPTTSPAPAVPGVRPRRLRVRPRTRRRRGLDGVTGARPGARRRRW